MAFLIFRKLDLCKDLGNHLKNLKIGKLYINLINLMQR